MAALDDFAVLLISGCCRIDWVGMGGDTTIIDVLDD